MRSGHSPTSGGVPCWRRSTGSAIKRCARSASRTASLGDDEPITQDETAERDLTYLGMAGIIDPARPEARAAIALAVTAGIRTLMITGDHPRTAARIAADLGIAGVDRPVLTGRVIASGGRPGRGGAPHVGRLDEVENGGDDVLHGRQGADRRGGGPIVELVGHRGRDDGGCIGRVITRQLHAVPTGRRPHPLAAGSAAR